MARPETTRPVDRQPEDRPGGQDRRPNAQPGAPRQADDQRQMDRLLAELEAFLEETRAIRRFYHGPAGCPFSPQETQVP